MGRNAPWTKGARRVVRMNGEYARPSNELMLFKVWGWDIGKDNWVYIAAKDWKELVEHLGEEVDNVKKIEDSGHIVEVVGL